MLTTHRKKAFTLVELLVVIAIIGMLVGILLPAVQAARDAGRRTQNTNNLKNIGLAMLSHNESQSALPALRYIRPTDGNRQTQSYPEQNHSVSWAFELLPYMEQSNIYDRFDKTQPVGSPANQMAMGSLIPVYANPRQGEARSNCPLPGSSAPGTCIDYAANRGLYTGGSVGMGPLAPQHTMDFQQHARFVGPFVHNQKVTTAHVKDGMSKTIAIGDKWLNPQTIGSTRFAEADSIGRAGGLAGASSNSMMRGPIVNLVDFPRGDAIEPAEAGGIFPTAMDTSPNKLGGPGGGMLAVSYLDGHVQWFDYTNTDPNVYAAQCTIAGNEVYTDDGG